MMATHSNDKINSRAKAHTQDEADSKASASLDKDNDQGREGQFSLDGDIRLTAGSNFNLTGFKRFDGKYQVKQAIHRISRSTGYTTEVQFVGLDAVKADKKTGAKS